MDYPGRCDRADETGWAGIDGFCWGGDREDVCWRLRFVCCFPGLVVPEASGDPWRWSDGAAYFFFYAIRAPAVARAAARLEFMVGAAAATPSGRGSPR